MEINHTDYHVAYNPLTATVTCQGVLRLQGSEEYAPILAILTAAADAKPATLTLDINGLQFLNSSGINTLSKFVLYVRKHNASQLIMQGSSRHPWQQKSLQNFQRLLPGLQVRIITMEINHADYHVTYDPLTATVTCQGMLRLQGSEEYAPLLEILTAAADAKPATLTLDIRGLQFLNSSGINTLSKFVLYIRKYNASQLIMQGSSQCSWQQKSLQNFQRLLPGLHLEIA